MEQNHIALESALTPEAAADEPVSPVNLLEEGGFRFANEEEEDAFWKGVSHGIRCAGREPAHPHMPREFSLDLARDPASPGLVSAKPLEAWPLDEEVLPGTGRETATHGGVVEGAPSVSPADTHHSEASTEKSARAPRRDGWTGAAQTIFLDTLARTGIVTDACRAAGISREAAYSFRKRASGRAFALAWDAAILLSRRALADDVMSRARHGVIDRVYRNGELVAERHRYDNRLAMAVLARLDRQAEGMGEGAATSRTIAGEWDQFLDIVRAGGADAEAFLKARGPSAKADPAAAQEVESNASLLARLQAYRKYEAGLPHEIRTSDLDPALMASWTPEQWARAEFSGLLDRLPFDQWPRCGHGAEETGADGSCEICQHKPAAPEDSAGEEDDFEGRDVWEENEGEWFTDFPPPEGFDRYEEGEPGEDGYKRELTEEELAAVGMDAETLDAERAERLAAEHAARDRFFGFTPSRPEAARRS